MGILGDIMIGAGSGIERGVNNASNIQRLWNDQRNEEYNKQIRPLQLAAAQRNDTLGKMKLAEEERNLAEGNREFNLSDFPQYAIANEEQRKILDVAIKPYVNQNGKVYKRDFSNITNALKASQEAQLVNQQLNRKLSDLNDMNNAYSVIKDPKLRKYLEPSMTGKNPEAFWKIVGQYPEISAKLEEAGIRARNAVATAANKPLTPAVVKMLDSAVEGLYFRDEKTNPIVSAAKKQDDQRGIPFSIFKSANVPMNQKQAAYEIKGLAQQIWQQGMAKTEQDAAIMALKEYHARREMGGEQGYPATNRQMTPKDLQNIDELTRVILNSNPELKAKKTDEGHIVVGYVDGDNFTPVQDVTSAYARRNGISLNGAFLTNPSKQKPPSGTMEFRSDSPGGATGLGSKLGAESMDFRSTSPAGSTGLGATPKKKVYRLEDYLVR